VSEAEPGPDGKLRCPWALSAPDFLDYHDNEWGRPVVDDDAMFERLSLEAFQSGLSWLIILRKRPAFRAAFADFSIEKVAGFGQADVDRLLDDTGIVRNRSKIEATITNARAALELPDGLTPYINGFAPTTHRAAPTKLGEVPSTSPESTALSKDLRKRGFKFVGPTTSYSLFQATGIVNDHVANCWRRGR
jgi:DNA-3-methyladenine glycosylase I